MIVRSAPHRPDVQVGRDKPWHPRAARTISRDTEGHRKPLTPPTMCPKLCQTASALPLAKP